MYFYYDDMDYIVGDDVLLTRVLFGCVLASDVFPIAIGDIKGCVEQYKIKQPSQQQPFQKDEALEEARRQANLVKVIEQAAYLLFQTPFPASAYKLRKRYLMKQVYTFANEVKKQSLSMFHDASRLYLILDQQRPLKVEDNASISIPYLRSGKITKKKQTKGRECSYTDPRSSVGQKQSAFQVIPEIFDLYIEICDQDL
ncbi:MAG: hypothetical protein EZS28_001222 [Streblomastix strix]|uniref:Uncharacterized protein n=1 Tax=Streblomastix strix TaxID=222440 RepID=A0A5J4X7S5_9EUKA|nr:MAG: hypothetical protein EZS28_001222 [Streblomastix strix]